MKRYKKPTIIAAIAILAVIIIVCTIACTQDRSDEIIAEELDSQLSVYTEMTDETRDGLRSELEELGYGDLGLSSAEMLDSMMDKFNYIIEDVTVDGDHATATVSITSKKLSTLKDNLQGEIDRMTADPDALVDIPEDDLRANYATAVMRAFDQMPLTNEKMTFEYDRQDNVWVMTQESQTELENILVR